MNAVAMMIPVPNCFTIIKISKLTAEFLRPGILVKTIGA